MTTLLVLLSPLSIASAEGSNGHNQVEEFSDKNPPLPDIYTIRQGESAPFGGFLITKEGLKLILQDLESNRRKVEEYEYHLHLMQRVDDIQPKANGEFLNYTLYTMSGIAIGVLSTVLLYIIIK